MMKKSLLVVAIAAATAVPALAQSSVTMYGRMNMTLERQKIGDESTSEMVNNASRIGMKGVEDLGGGLKAGFQIEHRFNADTGAQTGSVFWAGQSEVWLGGNFGTVRLGRYTSEAYYATADYVSMHNHDTGTSSDAFYAYPYRDDNRIGYTSPSWSGFVFHGSVGVDGPPDQGRSYDLAAQFDSGPLHLGAGYSRLAIAGVKTNQFGLRALYEFGAFTVGGYVQRDSDVYFSGNRTSFRLAGMYTLGASEFHLNFGRAGSYSDVDNTSANQITVGYNYNLSKRTKLYGFYTRVSNGDNATYATGAPGVDFSSIAAGIRHNF